MTAVPDVTFTQADIDAWTLLEKTKKRIAFSESAKTELLVLLDVSNEIARQDKKWGSQRDLAPEMWMTILMEEVGEVAKEVLEQDDEKLETELIQCAAVIVNWLRSKRLNAALSSRELGQNPLKV